MGSSFVVAHAKKEEPTCVGMKTTWLLPTPASLNSLVWATKRLTAVNNYTIDVYVKFMPMSSKDGIEGLSKNQFSY